MPMENGGDLRWKEWTPGTVPQSLLAPHMLWASIP